MRLAPAPKEDQASSKKITISTTIRGDAAEEFEQLCEKNGLNKSQLAIQMIYHCLNKTQDLKDFYRRIQILG